jgi:large subunit ribosomal protein L6
MSRVGKKIIEIPSNVEVKIEGNNVFVKGPLGELTKEFTDLVTIHLENNTIQVGVLDEKNKKSKAIWGTTRALIQNMIIGVSTGFTKQVELNGVGYRMELTNELILFIGFSHPVKVVVPDGIKLKLEKNVLSGTSIDKQLIGSFFSNVHDMKPCDAYKQKGFKFPGRFYIKKVGKRG